MRFPSLNTGILLSIASSILVQAFSFTAGPATQCDNLSLSWTGGQGPFQLLMTPVFGSPHNVSIPPTAQGSFSLQLPFPKGQRILLTMSDATGFGSGGTTDILTVGASVGGTTCNTVSPAVAFEFQLNSALQQCRPYTFSGYNGAVLPVTVMALIPGGQSTVVTSPVGSTTFNWLANVQAGTSMVFLMVDSQGRQGGSSNVMTVGTSNDNTCLSGSSPSSTSATIPTSKTAPKSPSKSNTPSKTTPRPKQSDAAGGTSKGAIAGGVIGALVALAALVALGIFFLKRRRQNSRPFGEDRSRRQSRRLQSLDNIHYQAYSYPHPSPMTSNPPSATHFMPHHADPYTSPLPQTSYDGSTSMRGPPPEGPYGSENPNLMPPLSQGSYDIHPNMRPAPSQSGPPFDAQPSMRSSPQQPLPFGADPNMRASEPQTYTQHNTDPYMQRPPSPSLLPYDTDPDVSLEPPSHQYTNSQSTSATTTAQQKAAEAGEMSHKPTRFILHTDVDELQPNEHGIVDLPPQYSDRR